MKKIEKRKNRLHVKTKRSGELNHYPIFVKLIILVYCQDAVSHIKLVVKLITDVNKNEGSHRCFKNFSKKLKSEIYFHIFEVDCGNKTILILADYNLEKNLASKKRVAK